MEKRQSSVISEARSEICEGLSVTYNLIRHETNGRAFYSVTLYTDDHTESATADDITGNKDEAVLIFDMLHRGKVTPCCLTEVVEDLIESIPNGQ